MRRFGKFSVESYGQLPGGEVVWLVRLRADSGLQAEVLTLGATLHSLNVPTDSGSVDVVLGKLSLEGYLQNGLCNSSVIGRCANRIEGGTFTRPAGAQLRRPLHPWRKRLLRREKLCIFRASGAAGTAAAYDASG